MVRLIIILAVVLAVALIAVFTPLIPWLGDTEPEPQPTPTPTTMPTPTSTPTPKPTSKPTSTPTPQPTTAPPPDNTRIFTEEELQKIVDEYVEKANQSSSVNIEYINVKLEPDKMLISVKGEALGYQGETVDNIEVRFEGRTVYAEGTVKALGFTPVLKARAELKCEGGKPAVEVQSFALGGLPLKMLGITKEKISGMINDVLESRGITFICEIESIRIEDNKLILVQSS